MFEEDAEFLFEHDAEQAFVIRTQRIDDLVEHRTGEALGLVEGADLVAFLLGLVADFVLLAAQFGGLSVALSTIGPAWLTPTVVALLLLLIALLRAGGLRRTAVESFARWCIAAGTTGGLAYFVGQLVRA
jgi:hypothetical protein